jgi:hypothetical protein
VAMAHAVAVRFSDIIIRINILMRSMTFRFCGTIIVCDRRRNIIFRINSLRDGSGVVL